MENEIWKQGYDFPKLHGHCVWIVEKPRLKDHDSLISLAIWDSVHQMFDCILYGTRYVSPENVEVWCYATPPKYSSKK